MSQYTVALCYSRGVGTSLLESIRRKTNSFDIRAEYFFNVLAKSHSAGRNTLKLSRGYDLVVVVCDQTPGRSEYDLLGNFVNHLKDDPWATCVVSVGSPEWKKPQPTVAIESERYLGYFHSDKLPDDFLALLLKHREHLFDRGLTKKEWKSIESCVLPREWVHIQKLRELTV